MGPKLIGMFLGHLCASASLSRSQQGQQKVISEAKCLDRVGKYRETVRVKVLPLCGSVMWENGAKMYSGFLKLLACDICNTYPEGLNEIIE